jgi:hypothetical protein
MYFPVVLQRGVSKPRTRHTRPCRRDRGGASGVDGQGRGRRVGQRVQRTAGSVANCGQQSVSSKRSGIASIREQGIDVEMANWRGVFTGASCDRSPAWPGNGRRREGPRPTSRTRRTIGSPCAGGARLSSHIETDLTTSRVMVHSNEGLIELFNDHRKKAASAAFFDGIPSSPRSTTDRTEKWLKAPYGRIQNTYAWPVLSSLQAPGPGVLFQVLFALYRGILPGLFTVLSSIEPWCVASPCVAPSCLFPPRGVAGRLARHVMLRLLTPADTSRPAFCSPQRQEKTE